MAPVPPAEAGGYYLPPPAAARTQGVKRPKGNSPRLQAGVHDGDPNIRAREAGDRMLANSRYRFWPQALSRRWRATLSRGGEGI
jgi:hypothetical protein